MAPTPLDPEPIEAPVFGTHPKGCLCSWCTAEKVCCEYPNISCACDSCAKLRTVAGIEPELPRHPGGCRCSRCVKPLYHPISNDSYVLCANCYRRINIPANTSLANDLCVSCGGTPPITADDGFILPDAVAKQVLGITPGGHDQNVAASQRKQTDDNLRGVFG